MIEKVTFKQNILKYKTIHNAKYGGNVAFWDFLHLTDLR